MNYKIKAKEIFLEDKAIQNSEISVINGKINIENNLVVDFELIDLTKYTLIPGLIDIHVHGGNGYDTMDMEYNSINEISKYKILEGVTSFCPTTVTSSIENTKQAIKTVEEAMSKGVEGASILGSFLEGPYINPEYKGAHPESFIRKVDLNEIKEIYETGRSSIKSFAIAPELNRALDVIEYLTNKGVSVRIGHSNATYEEVIKAIKKGSKIAIHVFNAMSPFKHRDVGMVGAVLLSDEIYAELICDLIHVSPEAIKILVNSKGTDKIILITDCMMAGGLCDGKYILGELEVTVRNSVARIDNGALAGSTLTLLNAVKNIHNVVGVSLFDSVKMATQNPAKAINIYNSKGSITTGKDADLIAIDDSFNVKFVMVNGEIKFNS